VFSNVDRVILAVDWNTSLDTEHIVRQLARRSDLARLQNTDKVYFLDRLGMPHLVYSRRVRDLFDGRGRVAPRAQGSLLRIGSAHASRTTRKGSWASFGRLTRLRASRWIFSTPQAGRHSRTTALTWLKLVGMPTRCGSFDFSAVMPIRPWTSGRRRVASALSAGPELGLLIAWQQLCRSESCLSWCKSLSDLQRTPIVERKLGRTGQ
jgi:hypothetical protein